MSSDNLKKLAGIFTAIGVVLTAAAKVVELLEEN